MANLSEHDRRRLPHVVLDQPSRILKAQKIIALLGNDIFRSAHRILEIGCGSGVIAATLAQLGEAHLTVFAVDVADNRLVREGYVFEKVDGTTLPFDAGSFDIVITNHVIEHVGDHKAQLHHLREIARVLKPSGVAYLAVPNKWRLLEPHFRLPVLSWFPQAVADRYVRLARKGNYYDCTPLSRRQARRLFEQAGFRSQNRTIDALRATLEIEFPRSRTARWISRNMPSRVVAYSLAIIPTHIFLLRPK